MHGEIAQKLDALIILNELLTEEDPLLSTYADDTITALIVVLRHVFDALNAKNTNPKFDHFFFSVLVRLLALPAFLKKISNIGAIILMDELFVTLVNQTSFTIETNHGYVQVLNGLLLKFLDQMPSTTVLCGLLDLLNKYDIPASSDNNPIIGLLLKALLRMMNHQMIISTQFTPQHCEEVTLRLSIYVNAESRKGLKIIKILAKYLAQARIIKKPQSIDQGDPAQGGSTCATATRIEEWLNEFTDETESMKKVQSSLEPTGSNEGMELAAEHIHVLLKSLTRDPSISEVIIKEIITIMDANPGNSPCQLWS
jgi:hypothetical protein